MSRFCESAESELRLWKKSHGDLLDRVDVLRDELAKVTAERDAWREAAEELNEPKNFGYHAEVWREAALAMKALADAKDWSDMCSISYSNEFMGRLEKDAEIALRKAMKSDVHDKQG